MQFNLDFPTQNIKLIAVDLDGTLLNSDHEVSDRTAEAARAASQKGYELVVCTGRRFASSLPHLEKLGCTDEVVVNNGIVVKDVRTCETICSTYMDAEVYPQVISALRETGLPFIVLVDSYPGKDILIEPVDKSNEYHLEFVRYNDRYCETVNTLDMPPSDKLIEAVVFEDYDRLRRAENQIKKSIADLVDCFTIRGVRYKGCSLELMPKGVSKWHAIEHLMKLRGISSDEVLAIGDDVNDIEMIRGAGVGIAMGNAYDEVKAVADFLTRNRDEDGAAVVIEKLLLD